MLTSALRSLHIIRNRNILRPVISQSISQSLLSYNKQQNIQPVLVSIEGNIGAGKSTLLQKLRLSNPEWVFIDEPVDTWSSIKNAAGESILEVFYKDRVRWSYTFQNCALLTRYENIENTVKEEKLKHVDDEDYNGKKIVFLTERCLETDYHVFTEMLKADGSIDDLEYNLYVRLLKQLQITATPLSAIVHVDTTPVVCSERIKKRSRSGEEAISMDYLESLNNYQCAWVHSTSLPMISTDLADLQPVIDFISSFTK